MWQSGRTCLRAMLLLTAASAATRPGAETETQRGREAQRHAAGCEPPQCQYTAGSGIYWSTYGSALQSPVVSQESLALLDRGLALPYVVGIAHYQNWSSLESARGVFNWTVLDAIFAAAERHEKMVLLGLQQGVCAPRWLLEDPGVRTVPFVHANPGWYRWATLQTPPDLITFAPPWHNPVYEAAVGHLVRAVAARYGSHASLSWVNVAGPSASAGVEANFNIDWDASRVAFSWRGSSGAGGINSSTNDHAFDRALNYTKTSYVTAWKQRIDLYDEVFPAHVRLGMATHDQNGDYGWGAGVDASGAHAGKVVAYSVADKMAAAREIRDHLLSRAARSRQLNAGRDGSRRPTPVVRCCGGSSNAHVYGNLTPHGTPGNNGNFALLLWVRLHMRMRTLPQSLPRARADGRYATAFSSDHRFRVNPHATTCSSAAVGIAVRWGVGS